MRMLLAGQIIGIAVGKRDGTAEGRGEGARDGRAEAKTEGRAEGRGDGMTEGRGDGFLVGIRDGVAVGITKQRSAAPTPIGMKPALQVQTEDPTAALLLAGQAWHCVFNDKRDPAPSNAAPGANVFTKQARHVNP